VTSHTRTSLHVAARSPDRDYDHHDSIGTHQHPSVPPQRSLFHYAKCQTTGNRKEEIISVPGSSTRAARISGRSRHGHVADEQPATSVAPTTTSLSSFRRSCSGLAQLRPHQQVEERYTVYLTDPPTETPAGSPSWVTGTASNDLTSGARCPFPFYLSSQGAADLGVAHLEWDVSDMDGPRKLSNFCVLAAVAGRVGGQGDGFTSLTWTFDVPCSSRTRLAQVHPESTPACPFSF